MWRLERVLELAGYRVINRSLASRRLDIRSAAEDYLAPMLTADESVAAGKIHFVTHSWGGIVVRHYLGSHLLPNLGRVVMIAPPNRGSEVADRLRESLAFRVLAGPSGQELGTGAASVPCRLGPVSYPVGVIAGDRTFNPLFSKWIGGPNDGKVSVQSTQVEGARECLVLHHGHTRLPWCREVGDAVLCFLATGSFAT